eukprot:365542-Chlamydomonas_euryale.AAC.26
MHGRTFHDARVGMTVCYALRRSHLPKLLVTTCLANAAPPASAAQCIPQGCPAALQKTEPPNLPPWLRQTGRGWTDTCEAMMPCP